MEKETDCTPESCKHCPAGDDQRAPLRWILRVLGQQSQNERLDKQDFTDFGALCLGTGELTPGRGTQVSLRSLDKTDG